VPYAGTPALPNRDYVLTLNTPQFRHFSANAFVIWGQDENFYEWSSSDILFTTLGVTLRPNPRLRADLNYQLQRFDRVSDGSTVGQVQIPRVRLEYQIARPMFVRVVGQYVAQRTDSLRDDGRWCCGAAGRSCARARCRATGCGGTCCSPTSRRRGRSSSPATGAR
jgi:hypothetical protein